jgi:hypothetical protein
MRRDDLMSNVGVHLGLYSAVRGLAELVDAVLLDLKSGRVAERVDRRRQLGTLLVGVADTSNRDVRSNVFRVLVRDSSKGQFDLGEVGKRLLADDAGGDSINKLELLAGILENERTSMLARMRGR